MRNLKYLILVSFFSYFSVAFSQTGIQFLSADEASDKLYIVDDFVSGLSNFDISARMKTVELKSRSEFLHFVASSTLNWSTSDISKVTQAFKSVITQINGYDMELPDKIEMILTNGREEGNAAYTRGNAIVLQRDKLQSNKDLKSLIAHEIFHIYTRNNPSKKNVLYKVIGFNPIPELVFPRYLINRKITNPDAPLNNYAIKITLNNESLWVSPILFSNTQTYILSKGGEFFEYLQFKLLVLEDDKKSNIEKPLILDISEVSGFFEQVGKNTNYIIHPEEILADNFALMTLGQSNIQSPEVVEKLGRTLLQFSLNKVNATDSERMDD